MKISIITVNYNTGYSLEKTMDSVLNQNYESIEYLVIDGGSKDNSLEIIKRKAKEFQKKGIDFKWVSEKDNGIYNAMNKGIKISSGEIIGIINSSDWYEKNIFSFIANKFKSNKINLFFGCLRTINNGIVESVLGQRETYGRGSHPTVFVNRMMYEKYGFFNEKYEIAADTDFLLKLQENKEQYYFSDKIISNFSLGGISTIEDNFFKTGLEINQINFEHGYYGIFKKLKKESKIKWRIIENKIKKFIKKG